MAKERGRLTGLTNIIWYNWPMYAIAGGAGLCLSVLLLFAEGWMFATTAVLLCLLGWNVVASLVVSWYVYDYSGYYDLNWLQHLPATKNSVWANIHAGLDETSATLLKRNPAVSLHVFDFYDEKKHTEPSIRRARAMATPFPATQILDTSNTNFPPNTYDVILVLLSAHEIRNDEERVQFFKALACGLKPNGVLVVAEHLRDRRNFLAYSLGAFHFLSLEVWLRTFRNSALTVTHTGHINPFITVFYCTNGAAH